MRRLLAVLVALLPACSGGSEPEPETDPLVGSWLLETVNDQALPATGHEVGPRWQGNDAVVGGRLVINEVGMGFPHWDYCLQDSLGSRSAGSWGYTRDLPLRYSAGEPGDDEAELSFIFPLWVNVDTLRLRNGVLIWEFNVNGESPDLLRFRRIAEGEFEGTPCRFLP
jgi:hypothetical protein